ncbi:hypothetical protein EST38_g7631 [Candolleomyces aberdarensis]|uniref:Nephrocystin 3-like N-terminal domain-containing protein n=1 Tax=Candolleomyces aberdarensis TaxID=2316362 RepID=A0A4Q2DGG0_9AGAR|nr:hypothetical protein EST38_g7631 [Candolleomyces aberdarensis]
MDLPRFTNFSNAHHFRIDNQNNTFIAGNQYQVLNVGEDLIRLLNPLLDASHTRNRRRSPPDSECFPGTRKRVIEEITKWADAANSGRPNGAGDEEASSDCSMDSTSFVGFDDSEWEVSSDNSSMVICHQATHIYWLHGFAGCGKSAVSLEVAKIYAGSGRLLASYFFFRGAGERSTMNRFATTLTSQLVTAIPATASFIEAAVRAQPGLLTGDAPLAAQLDLLILSPFQAVVDSGVLDETLAKGPFLMVIDGLDECEDKRGVEELIDCVLEFFEERPTIPLRVFIASRVEQHIRERLEVDGVRLGNLDSFSPRKDIEKFLQASFQAAAKRDRVIRAYVRVHGEWPAKPDMVKLIKYISKSFVLASTIFRFVVQPPIEGDYTTPMERLPMTLEMNGLDALYAQTLARSQHLPNFREIVSTIALLRYPLPIAAIADLLGIEVFKVVRVLLNLQAIVHVPGNDDEGDVTLCHTSLRDFLTTESRSGPFFVSPSLHLHLSYYCSSYALKMSSTRANTYCQVYFDRHWKAFTQSTGARNFINEIEEFNARHPPLVNQLSFHAFLCSMFFYSILTVEAPHPDTTELLYLLTECTKQLALAVESPDRRIRLWLEMELPFGLPDRFERVVHFTQDIYEALRPALRSASTAIHAKFPEMLERQPTSTGTEVNHISHEFTLSGLEIFNALQWIIARAQFKWEEAKISPRPPLKLTFDLRSHFRLSFDGMQ